MPFRNTRRDKVKEDITIFFPGGRVVYTLARCGTFGRHGSAVFEEESKRIAVTTHIRPHLHDS